MYTRDVPKIIDYVTQRGPQGLVDVGTFVLCSVQTPLSRVAPMVAEVKAKGVDAECLWGFKQAGYSALTAQQVPLYQKLVNTPSDRGSRTSVTMLLREVMGVYGFGIPKASFLLQLVGYNVGCLDMHNLKRYGLPLSFTKAPSTSPKVEKYVRYTQRKGAEELWDSWCAYVAGNRGNKSLPTADDVSAYHYHAITGDR